MNRTTSSTLYSRITRLRWQVPLLAFILVLIHQIIEHTWLLSLPPWKHFISQMLFYGLIGPTVAWWALNSIRRNVMETEAAQHALQEALTDLSEVNKQLACLIRVNRRLAEAEDEEALLSVILTLPEEVVPTLGCSLIRFDERQQPLPVLYHGQIDPTELETWAAQMSKTHIQKQCAGCTTHSASANDPCSFFLTIPHGSDTARIHCLELIRGTHTFGILTIFLAVDCKLTAQQHSLLQTIAQDMSLALESHRLRSRELEMLSHLKQATHLNTLRSSLADVLTHTVAALEVNGGVLFVTEMETAELYTQVEAGESLGAALSLVQGLASGAQQVDAPFIIRDLEQAESDGVRSLLIAPVRTESQTLGSLALWASRPNAFTRHRAQLVNIVAGQAALMLENHRLYLQGEHRAALAERARLAREIHDGLAQTLGYLKLRTAQIAGWLDRGDEQQTKAGLADVRQLLNEAYVDAREAIDGLHLASGQGGVEAWVQEIVFEFEMLSGLLVQTAVPPNIDLPLEVQAQLQRIVQEALSNIRKHAVATCAWLEWQLDEEQLRVSIRDNGRGFEIDNVPPVARHGLRIMRERADLLAADFQITSRLQEGTNIVIRLPLKNHVGEIQYE